MSAFFCSKNHISAIVHYAVANGIVLNIKESAGGPIQATPALAPNLFELLKLENARSLIARYGSKAPWQFAPDFDTWKFDEASNAAYSQSHNALFIEGGDKGLVSFSPASIVKLCRCYDYQACESNDWETTTAHDIVECIRAHAETKTTNRAIEDDRTWSI